MLACKSEIHPKAIDPFHASEMAAVYNVGLAECTSQSEEGKKRMRDCFSYLVKEVAKARSGRGKSRSYSLTRSQGHPLSNSGQLKMPPIVAGEELANATRDRNDSVSSSAAGSTASLLERSSMSSSLPRSGVLEGADGQREKNASDVESKLASHEDDTIVQRDTTRGPTHGASGYVNIEELWDKLFFAAVSGNGEERTD